MVTWGKPCPVSDLFGRTGRELLARLDIPEAWSRTLEASLRLINQLDAEITAQERELRRLGADHRYIPLLTTAPGIAWVLGFTIASEVGDIALRLTQQADRLHRPPTLGSTSPASTTGADG